MSGSFLPAWFSCPFKLRGEGSPPERRNTMLRLLATLFAVASLAAPAAVAAYPGDGGGGTCYRLVCYGPNNCYLAYIC